MASKEEVRNWVDDVKKEVSNGNPVAEAASWKKHSIYRVPVCIKNLNSKAYQPQVVSLGPFHHGDANLQPMDKHKRRSLVHLLRRAKKPLEEFVAPMEAVAEDLEGASQNLGDKWRGANRDRFLEMMIKDGRFMLEVMRTASGRPEARDYAADDPIFSKHGVLYTVPYILRDMFMIENQLPLLVLKKLMAVESGKEQSDDSINRMVLKFLSPTIAVGRPEPCAALGLQPLDVFHRKVLLYDPQKLRSPQKDIEGNIIVLSTVELCEAGIWFKKSKTNSLQDIRFRHGFLHLPMIVVDDSSEYMFLNMMAFERLHVGASNEVTAYVFFMDDIIYSAQDVALLSSKGIIQNHVGSDKAVAKLFNGLSKNVVLDLDSALANVQRMGNSYCGLPWNKWRANLIQTYYFPSPWVLLSLAVIVFL